MVVEVVITRVLCLPLDLDLDRCLITGDLSFGLGVGARTALVSFTTTSVSCASDTAVHILGLIQFRYTSNRIYELISQNATNQLIT